MVNRSVTWAAWDEELLTLDLQDLNEADFDLSLTGFDPKELERDILSHAGKISFQLSEEIANGEFEKYWIERKGSELAAVPELEKSMNEIRGRHKPKKPGSK
jgi:hypothetical protein